ncbi:MAG TPA: thioredoxin domain-containing protein [Acidobacteriaceae bacterium]|nr:thioredoxin domain-containing protein [Acidobacteriaceae bacterium]
MQSRLFSCILASFALSAMALAQNQPPSAPVPQTPGTPQAEQGPKFPPVEQANFTASSPTKAEVDAFLHATWGYDPNREWEVFGIQKTAAPGVAKVEVLVAEKPNPQVANFSFFITPDGKHLILQEQLLDFGAHPYENLFHSLQQRADGPSMGSKDKKFLLVEFADFQCPHCKEAEPVVQRLLKDFPQAHYVFESFPLVNIHPKAFEAATYGQCVFQQGGSDAFFKYADSTFAGQDALSGQGADQALRNSVTAAGLDPDKVAACSATDAAKNAVHESMQLGLDLNVNETPWLFVDGRGLPMLAVPYEQLKKIIAWQFEEDHAGTAK